MAIGGWAEGGASVLGRSRAYDSLPWKGYREVSDWLEQWIDAAGLELDILHQAFVTIDSRANLLDPTFTPEEAANEFQATATQAPTRARSQHTMLDLMLAISGIPWPVNGNLTTAQKQALVQAAGAAFRRKGNRIYMLDVASCMTDGVVMGWNVPPFEGSLILPDGAPNPGWGDWVPASGAVASFRPWILGEQRRVSGRLFPTAWSTMGVGYSQFRADFSAAGEPALPSGSRLNLLANEHFNAWGAGVPTSWTKLGSGTLTQGSTIPYTTYVNFEFYNTTPTAPDIARINLTGAGAGTLCGLQQDTQINNQIDHRIEFDYNYTNSQSASILQVRVTDRSNTAYWDVANEEWSSVDVVNAVPVTTTRARYGFTITPQAASSSSAQVGTQSIRVEVFARSDGTATTQTTYDLYRIAVYEKYSLDVETEALGERLLWLPLIDTMGHTTSTRTATQAIEIADAARSRTKSSNTTNAAFDYHPALSGRGYRSSSTWSNLLLGSNDFDADWTKTNVTVATSGTQGPEFSAGSTLVDASRATATAANPLLNQSNLVADPSSKAYIAGLFCKAISAGVTTVRLSLESLATTVFQDFAVTSEWQWLPMTAVTFTSGDTDPLNFSIEWSGNTNQIGLYGAYVYDVTGKTDALYPPLCRSAAGLTATVNPTRTRATSQTTGNNTLNQFTRRSLGSVVRGALSFTFVPTFGRNPGVTGHSQPNGVLFDIAEGAAVNRIVLRVASNVLELRRWDASGTNHAATLTLAYTADATTEVQWRRDEAITIRCVWNEVSTQLSAGESNATHTISGAWSPSDSATVAIGIGNDYNQANPIDGLFNDLEVVQVGAPTV